MSIVNSSLGQRLTWYDKVVKIGYETFSPLAESAGVVRPNVTNGINHEASLRSIPDCCHQVSDSREMPSWEDLWEGFVN